MVDALLASMLLAVGVPPADTTVELRPGDRIVIEELSGSLTITAWDRDAVDVLAEGGEGVIEVLRSGSTVHIGRSVTSRRGRREDTTVRVPSWIDIEVASTSMDVSIRGVGGALDVRNVSGDVDIADVDGPLEVRSVSGEIRVTDARGPVRASSQSDDVTLTRVAGPVEAHSGDGDIRLVDLRSPSVQAEAQDGDIDFDGLVADDGEYGFYVHDGDARIAVPEATNASVRVSTFDGDFESDFTVRVEHFTSGRRFDFVLGDGGADMEIEVFDGDIRLLHRP